MVILPCPWCGPRNVDEFHLLDETVARPDPAEATPEQWRSYLYLRRNTAGWVTETWFHRSGCRRFVVAERNTQTNEVGRTWRPGEAPPEPPPEPPRAPSTRSGSEAPSARPSPEASS